MTTAASQEAGTSLRRAPGNVVGAVLFIAWGIATIMWVASTIVIAADGDSLAIVTAVATIVLLIFLGVFEGLEVAVIDRWPEMWNPQRSTSQLAGWLAARQLFVALIVTSATVLSHRSEIIVWPGISITDELPLRIFDIAWTTSTVLYFFQILPKHLAATNPDRYLTYTRRWGFAIVAWVYKSGIPQPGAWSARALERRLDWPLTEAEEMQEAARSQPESLGHIWRQLPPARQATRGAHGSPGASQGGRSRST
jgi:hypothetical protein